MADLFLDLFSDELGILILLILLAVLLIVVVMTYFGRPPDLSRVLAWCRAAVKPWP